MFYHTSLLSLSWHHFRPCWFIWSWYLFNNFNFLQVGEYITQASEINLAIIALVSQDWVHLIEPGLDEELHGATCLVISDESVEWDTLSHMIKFIVYSVKCYHGGQNINIILSISEIPSQMWYHCVQYTKRHLMNLSSFCWHHFTWPIRMLFILGMTCTAGSAGHVKNKYNIQYSNKQTFEETRLAMQD